MNVARAPSELEHRPRAVAIGTFDGVHLGHRAVVRAAVDAGPTPTVVTFDPHPRSVLGNRVELLSTLERRLELLERCGVEDVLVVEFTPEIAGLEPEEFARRYLRRDRRRGRRRRHRLPVRPGSRGRSRAPAPRRSRCAAGAARRRHLFDAHPATRPRR